jgi:hypothetical protein
MRFLGQSAPWQMVPGPGTRRIRMEYFEFLAAAFVTEHAGTQVMGLA